MHLSIHPNRTVLNPRNPDTALDAHNTTSKRPSESILRSHNRWRQLAHRRHISICSACARGPSFLTSAPLAGFRLRILLLHTTAITISVSTAIAAAFESLLLAQIDSNERLGKFNAISKSAQNSMRQVGLWAGHTYGTSLSASPAPPSNPDAP